MKVLLAILFILLLQILENEEIDVAMHYTEISKHLSPFS